MESCGSGVFIEGYDNGDLQQRLKSHYYWVGGFAAHSVPRHEANFAACLRVELSKAAGGSREQ
jgi:hypothetical protein